MENRWENAREIDPKTFAARIAYQASKQAPTQNADGVHVGDLFCESWGYEQTNVSFFQVVALKGKHTAVLREIGRDYVGGYSWSGTARPERGHFIGDEITARTRKSPYAKDAHPQIYHKWLSKWMDPTGDDDEHSYSTYA